MQTVQSDPDDASALAAQLSQSLNVAVSNHHNLQTIEGKYLAAAALLATSPACSASSPPCYALLQRFGIKHLR